MTTLIVAGHPRHGRHAVGSPVAQRRGPRTDSRNAATSTIPADDIERSLSLARFRRERPNPKAGGRGQRPQVTVHPVAGCIGVCPGESGFGSKPHKEPAVAALTAHNDRHRCQRATAPVTMALTTAEGLRHPLTPYYRSESEDGSKAPGASGPWWYQLPTVARAWWLPVARMGCARACPSHTSLVERAGSRARPQDDTIEIRCVRLRHGQHEGARMDGRRDAALALRRRDTAPGSRSSSAEPPPARTLWRAW